MIRRDWVLLDRDGTLIFEKAYLKDPEEVELLPGAVVGLQKLKKAGFSCTVISNQSGIGRGFFRRDEADAVNQRLKDLLAREDITLKGIYYCPHRPDEGCRCRKPGIALVQKAAAEQGIGLDRLAAMVGDKAEDLKTGDALGIASILVRTGYGLETFAKGFCGDVCCDTLDDAARWIVQRFQRPME